MSVLSTLFNILSPRVMGLITNKLVEGIKLKLQGVVGSTVDFDYITKVLLLLGGLYIFSAFFSIYTTLYDGRYSPEDGI